MSIAFVRQVAKGDNGSVAVTTLVLTVGAAGAAAGDLVVVYGMMGGGRHVTSAADSKSNTWTVDQSVEEGTNHGISVVSSVLATALVSGDTITLTFGGTGRGAAIALEFSGIDSFDVGAAAGSASSTAYASGSTLTSAGADALIVGCVGQNGGVVAITPESLTPAWTEQDSIASDPTKFVRSVHALYRIVSDGPTTYANNGSFASAVENSAAVAVYKAAAGAGGAALAGTIAAAATAAGAVTTSITVAGTAAGAATAAAAPTTGILLAGMAAGAAATAAGLTIPVPLEGAVAGTSGGSGALETSITMAAAAAGIGSTAADLGTLQTLLAGSSAGAASSSAAVTTSILMGGGVAGVASVSGDATTSITMAGSSAGAAAPSADVTVAILLVGSVAGVVTVSGGITTTILLAGSSAGIASLSASLTASGSSPLFAAHLLTAATLTAATLADKAAARIAPKVEYVLEIFDDGTGHGPGTKVAELWDARNIGWAAYDRLPGPAVATLYQDSKLLAKLTPLLSHVRMTRLTPSATATVYEGVFIDYDSTADDVVLRFADYLALLALSRSGFRTAYGTKAIGTGIVSPEWTLAKGATGSILAFIASGVGDIEDPLGADGVTVIKTNDDFGTQDQHRLQLFHDLSEMGRANTSKTVSFFITRDEHTFRFLKNRGAARDLCLALGGAVNDYHHLPNWTAYRNDLASIATNADGGAGEIVKTDTGEITAKGLRQGVVAIETLLGIVAGAVESDQQAAVVARDLAKAIALTPALALEVVEGAVAPFDGWDICDTVPIEIANGVDAIAEAWRIGGVRCVYDEQGEHLGLILEAKAA